MEERLETLRVLVGWLTDDGAEEYALDYLERAALNMARQLSSGWVDARKMLLRAQEVARGHTLRRAGTIPDEELVDDGRDVIGGLDCYGNMG